MHFDFKDFFQTNFENGIDAFKYFFKEDNNNDNKKYFITIKEFFDGFESFSPNKYEYNTVLKYLNKYFHITLPLQNNNINNNENKDIKEQVLDEGFLELINNILTTGIVIDIFEKAEKKNQIIDDYKHLAVKLNLSEKKETAYGLYVNRIKENLHLVISMSPLGDNLRNSCRNFPRTY